MLFLFDNNGIDYWLQNNINDCCNSSISYNKNENKELELELDLELELEMQTIKQKSNAKNINNNYKQNKQNLTTEKHKHVNYNNYNNNYPTNKKYEKNISSLVRKDNTSQRIQNRNKKDKLSLLGSHEQPKLIDL
jgi:hypothetical protein